MIEDKRLKVLVVSSEMAPYAKSGGLGDVVGSLPKILRDSDIDVRVVIPRYSTINADLLHDVEYLGAFSENLSWRKQEAKILIKKGDVPVYFVENDFYFGRGGFYGYGDDNERFAFFCKVVLDMLPMINFHPDIIQCSDWQTGPISLYLNEIYKKVSFYSTIKTVFTIHNLQYQGIFDLRTIEMLDVPYECYENGNIEFHGNVSYMKMGLMYSDWITTVSKTYAEEIQTHEYGYGIDGVLRNRRNRLIGILNGIDYGINNPATDPRITKNFDKNTSYLKVENKTQLQRRLGLEERDVPVISMITRLAQQKGFDIFCQMFDEMMQEDVQFVLLGTGQKEYEYMFMSMAERYPGRVSVNISFDDTLAQQIYASSDMFLMPSLFEPCGLGQMFSLRYGTIPIVRKTGGLADTVTHYNTETKCGNGFVFKDYDRNGLLWAVKEAINVYYMGSDEWNNVVQNAMNSNYSWENSAREYIELYESLVNR